MALDPAATHHSANECTVQLPHARRFLALAHPPPLLGTAQPTLILDRESPVVAEHPLLQELSRVYDSEDGSILDVQAFRSPTEKQDGGASPFGENEILRKS